MPQQTCIFKIFADATIVRKPEASKASRAPVDPQFPHPRRLTLTAEQLKDSPRPRVTLGEMGVLEGITKMTVGNQDHEAKPINYFRNIPFGVVPQRFAVRLIHFCDHLMFKQ